MPAVTGAVVGAATGYILGGLYGALSPALQDVYTGVLIAGGVANIGYGASQGQYIASGVGAVMLALGLAEAFSRSSGAAGNSLSDETKPLSGSGGDVAIDRELPFPGFKDEVIQVAGSGGSTQTQGLKPGFRSMVEEILIELELQGWEPRVAEGLRTPAQQAAKVAAKLSKTLNSAHVKGYGADIIDRRFGWGGPAAKHSFRFWHELGAAAQARGLTWGGSWRSFPDPAHVEMQNWRSMP